MTERTRIQNAIITLIKSGPFFAVSYSPTTGLVEEINVATAPHVSPVTVYVNETDSGFSLDSRNGRDEILVRNSWQFEALADFSVEVDVSEFEKLCMRNITVLPRDSVNGLGQARLYLQKSSYRHPVQQQNSTGTSVVLEFTVIVDRL